MEYKVGNVIVLTNPDSITKTHMKLPYSYIGTIIKMTNAKTYTLIQISNCHLQVFPREIKLASETLQLLFGE